MKTTAKHFEIFRDYTEYYIDVFGLKGWEVFFEHNSLENKNQAEVEFNIVDRWATFTLSTNYAHRPTDKDLERSAFHEVVKLFLGRLYHLALKRNVRKEELDEETHVIVRTLGNVML